MTEALDRFERYARPDRNTIHLEFIPESNLDITLAVTDDIDLDNPVDYSWMDVECGGRPCNDVIEFENDYRIRVNGHDLSEFETHDGEIDIETYLYILTQDHPFGGYQGPQEQSIEEILTESSCAKLGLTANDRVTVETKPQVIEAVVTESGPTCHRYVKSEVGNERKPWRETHGRRNRRLEARQVKRRHKREIHETLLMRFSGQEFTRLSKVV